VPYLTEKGVEKQQRQQEEPQLVKQQQRMQRGWMGIEES
jgi:hypothetical protein